MWYYFPEYISLQIKKKHETFFALGKKGNHIIFLSFLVGFVTMNAGVATRVSLLREVLKRGVVCHQSHILQEHTLHHAHIYCVLNGLSAQKFGPLLEWYIIRTFGLAKNSASDCTGDCKVNDVNTEIKVSLGGQRHNKFNYVQIRVHHDVSHYLLTAFSLSAENVEREGELFLYWIDHAAMMTLVLNHGTYAHGTKKTNGPIDADSLRDIHNTKEYALRTKVGDTCWNALQAFRITESDFSDLASGVIDGPAIIS